MAEIVITECSWGSSDVETEVLQAEHTVRTTQADTEEALIEACKNAAGILAEYAPLTRRVLSELPNCRIISNSAIGVDNIDLDAARELGIAVANVPNYCAHEVADHAMALMLAALRNVVGYERKVRAGVWDIDDARPLHRLAGLKLGLLGFGRIPQMVSRRARGFEMEVMAHDPYVAPEIAEQHGVRLASMDDILAECDIISCHIPLMPSTAGSIDKSVFAKMRKRPLFVNTSRGRVIVEEDLVEALRSGVVSYAALDVLRDEPPDFGSAIFDLDNVIITPHAAFYSEEALREVRVRSANNVLQYLKGNLDAVDFVVRP